jgi:hypothetical protein
MLVNDKTTPCLTVVFVTSENDISLERRLDNLFSIRVAGLDIVLLDSGIVDSQQLDKYWHLAPVFRRVKLEWTDDLDLFEKAIALCRGEFFYLSKPGHLLNGLFFENALAHLRNNKSCNLVYCRPSFLEGDNVTLACSSTFSTENYLPVSRAAVSIYTSSQDNFEMEGIIRADQINVASMKLTIPTWKKSVLFDLACRGYFHCSNYDYLTILVKDTDDLPRSSDLTLLNNQVRSIWRHFDQANHRCLLSLASIFHRIFEKRTVSAPVSKIP